jgi:hypothetical protein
MLRESREERLIGNMNADGWITSRSNASTR